jgi:phage FluMu gp28-like protein
VAFAETQIITQDEASQAKKRYPAKTYLQEVAHFLDSEPMLAFPKSRRMLMTWITAAYCLWRARYWPNNAIFWQSETEDKSAFVVQERCQFIEDNLVNVSLRRAYRATRTTKGVVGRLQYLSTKSYIWGIPEGGNVLRTYTPTILVMDECEFQPESHEALTAAMPFVEKGAKLILLSSSNGPNGILAGICREIGFARFS